MDIFITGIYIAVFIGIAWVANRHAKRDRFPLLWHLAMGGIAIAHSVVLSFMVMGLGGAFGVVGISAIWFLVWIILLVALGRNGKSRDIKLLCLYPLAHIFIGFGSNIITREQIRNAEMEGDRMFERIEAFHITSGRYPDSLEELESADGIPILETGVGFWGNQKYRYYKYKDDDFDLHIDGFVGIQYFRTDEGKWYGED